MFTCAGALFTPPASRLPAAFSTLLWFGVAAGVVAQDRDPDAKIAGGGTLPAGWHARTDKNRPLADAKIQTMGTGLHTTLGPAVILWRDPGQNGRAHVFTSVTNRTPIAASSFKKKKITQIYT